MAQEKTGRIVWHDLFTADEDTSKSFYQGVAGWSYLTEHATDFAWGGGDKDFVLAMLDNEAGAGLLSQNQLPLQGWVPYVEVDDVDRAADLATKHGGSVIRSPFEVPGVGRNSLLRDPLGACFGVSVSRHTYPIPTRQFTTERYCMNNTTFPIDFYRLLFGWHASPRKGSEAGQTIALSEHIVAICESDPLSQNTNASWVPGIRVKTLAEASGAVRSGSGTLLTSLTSAKPNALARDPMGALICLVEA